MWRLVKEAGDLDLNSAYCYIMLSEYFPDTCVVAEAEGRLVGFATAFRAPANPDVLFIWQIGVASAFRGHGLGLSLLTSLLQRESCRGVSMIEATITPSNRASKALFSALARTLNTAYAERSGFPEQGFPERHDREDLVRIGPFDPLSIASERGTHANF